MTGPAFPARMAKKEARPPVGTKGAADWYWKRYTELYPKYFWADDTIGYLLSWLGCAKQHGLSIDYLGGKNESSYDEAWFEKLHATLAAHHLPVICGHEGSGIVREVGADVRDLAVGDHIITSFMPTCGSCRWCASGSQNLLVSLDSGPTWSGMPG